MLDMLSLAQHMFPIVLRGDRSTVSYPSNFFIFYLIACEWNADDVDKEWAKFLLNKTIVDILVWVGLGLS